MVTLQILHLDAQNKQSETEKDAVERRAKRKLKSQQVSYEENMRKLKETIRKSVFPRPKRLLETFWKLFGCSHVTCRKEKSHKKNETIFLMRAEIENIKRTRRPAGSAERRPINGASGSPSQFSVLTLVKYVLH